jgi:hypothetical protein
VPALLGHALLLLGECREEAGVELLLRNAVQSAQESRDSAERALLRDARSHLALLLAQQRREGEASQVMRTLGCTYRLAPEVLSYDMPPAGDGAEHVEVAAALDGALPPSLVAHLSACFAPGAGFWQSHRYHCPETGYFSYSHVLGDAAAPPTTAWEQALGALHTLAAQLRPECGRATHVEWWAHCRPHSSGHQLHYDSDAEGLPDESGQPRHPIASCVLYLSSDDAANVGGPTLVTQQRRGNSALGQAGWLGHPSPGRLLVFDGSVLHGVLPGRGPSPAPGQRRVTLMVAFWDGIDIIAGDKPGASRPFPHLGRPDTPDWASRLAAGPVREEWAADAVRAHAQHSARKVALQPLPRVWADVDEQRNAADGVALAQLQGMPHYNACFQGF